MVRRCAAGQAIVEFAVILPVLLILTLGLIDLGRGFTFGVATQDAARQAVRLAAKGRLDLGSSADQTKRATFDRAVFQRLIDGAAPALSGCTLPGTIPSTPFTLTTSTCPAGAGTWTLTLVVTPAGGFTSVSRFADLINDDARAHLDGGTVEVKAVGSVSLLNGFSTGAMRLGLYSITVQGDAVMVIL
jgi:Flp pilus assembly protein TadG